MGIGASVFLLAAGAILSFAIDQQTWEGVNLDTVGIILMAAGAIGLIMFLTIWGPRDRVETYAEPRRPVVERRVYE